MNRSTISLTIFSVVVLAISIGLQYLQLDWIHSYLPYMVGFYWLQFLLMDLLNRLFKDTLDVEEVFILLGGVTARLLIAIMVMIIVAIVAIDQSKLFIVNFAVLYLIYLVFEIKGVLSNLRSNLK
ncbi:hypothetical protein [Reichenbachiella versicolor]|uniref:hypothetical protein n=1 Tax=Reichenbachiella versicolor TaxID=1821036 RepID=UPI000D6E4C60|nr:hypothetical protein [Reichenbachiella versicolor]